MTRMQAYHAQVARALIFPTAGTGVTGGGHQGGRWIAQPLISALPQLPRRSRLSSELRHQPIPPILTLPFSTPFAQSLYNMGSAPSKQIEAGAQEKLAEALRAMEPRNDRELVEKDYVYVQDDAR